MVLGIGTKHQKKKRMIMKTKFIKFINETLSDSSKKDALLVYLKYLGFKQAEKDNLIVFINPDYEKEMLVLPKKLTDNHYRTTKKHLDEWGYLSDEDLIEYDELFELE
jgi:hypothetical protein